MVLFPTKLNVHLEQFSSSLSKMSVTIDEKTSSLQSSLASATSVLPNQHASSPSTVINSNRQKSFDSLDRSANVILFGLPESSPPNTKADIDDVVHHLISRSSSIKDAFRLGRHTPSSSSPQFVTAQPPRPLIIKFNNLWDRRLALASRRKLKDYTKYKLFIREDLPPAANTPSESGSTSLTQHS